MRGITENTQGQAPEPEPIVSVSGDELLGAPGSDADEHAAVKETSPQREKKSVGKLLMIPIAVGIIVAGVAFGLPLIFSTRKEPGEVSPETTIPDVERSGETERPPRL